MSRQERERMQLVETVTQHAESLFRQNGYENTTIDALAANSEYTKRTIYRYFASKEDLYFAVMLKGHMLLHEAINTGTSKGKSGHEKITLAYNTIFTFFRENGWLFDLISHLQSIKSKKPPGDLPYFEKYASCIELIHKEIISLFVMAHNDKSIRTDLDPRHLGFSSTFILNGFFHMLRLYGDFFTQNQYPDQDQFIGFTIDFLSQTLNAPATDNWQ